MTKRRLVWRPNIEILDIHKLLSHAVNKVMSQDPLLFLTVPDLRLLMNSAFKQVSVLCIEDVELKFQIYYDYYCKSNAAIIDKLCIELIKFPCNGSDEKYDRYRTVGIKFMSNAFDIAPRLSRRDVLLAGVFVYLKGKEKLLCR